MLKVWTQKSYKEMLTICHVSATSPKIWRFSKFTGLSPDGCCQHSLVLFLNAEHSPDVRGFLSTPPSLFRNCHSLAIGQCSSVHSKPSEINVVKRHIQYTMHWIVAIHRDIYNKDLFLKHLVSNLV